ncbi:MAG: TIGR03067 domain-containing protein [Ignavibacteriae bacterium]|nr:TIGR03067 domain-containing protein [Ignavibacteriota bacterium]
MRYFTVLLSLIIVSITLMGFTFPGHDELKGTWIPVRQEMAGAELPDVIFKKQQLVLNDSNYTFIAESADKGVVIFDIENNKMDIYGKDGVNAGKHFKAIYKLEDELLTICYDLSGMNYPESFETGSSPALFLSVFKRETSE